MSSTKTSDNASVRPKIRSKQTEKLKGEPLEKRTIRFEDRDGIERYYPALHIKFSHAIVFIKYFRPPLKTIADSRINGHDLQNNDWIKKWIQNSIGFEEMVKTLLRLQHNQFWSTLVHEKSLQICLESYLRSAPRGYDLHNFLLTDQIKDHIKRTHILVFKLYLRICSFAESKTNFITESTYGSLIYDNYVMDVPKMFDLCLLYSNTNYRHLLSRMLSNVIQCQPRYEEDLLKSCSTICEALLSIQQKAGTDDNEFQRINKLSYFQWPQLQSLVTDITDISVTLEAIIQLIPNMSEILKKGSVDKSMAEFYNRVFPCLQNELNSRLDSIKNNDSIVDQIRGQLLTSRSHFVLTFRHLIEVCFLDKLMDKNFENKPKVSLIDEFVETLTLAAFEKCFIIDYCMKYPVERDFDLLSKHSETTRFESFDKTRIDYLQNVIQSSVCFEPKPQTNQNEETVNGFVATEDINESDIEMESKIQYINEIMPELGKGFIQKCLIYFDSDNERVLNAILENNLPPHLESMDRTLQKSVKTPINVKTEEKMKSNSNETDISPKVLPEVIETRDNIYNCDEFDIFRNKNIDLTRIHSGKRDKPEPKIDNKFKEKVMNLHLNASEDEETDLFMNYNDEWDDTYEDDTKIDLPSDKLMDELDVKPGDDDIKEDINDESNSINSNERESKNRYKTRNYYKPKQNYRKSYNNY